MPTPPVTTRDGAGTPAAERSGQPAHRPDGPGDDRPGPSDPSAGPGTDPAAGPAGARQGALREYNLAVLVQELFGSSTARSRADLSARTGMTRSTVSRLVEDLLAAGIVAENPAPAGRRGRPAVPLSAAPGTLLGLGLEVNVDYVAGRLLDLRGATVAERLVPSDMRGSDPAVVLPALGDLGRELVTEAGPAARLVGTVLALPGLVDSPAGRLLLAPNLGWRELRPAPLLGADLGEVTIANEAKLAALATATEAPGRLGPDRTFLYVSAQVGVGSAAVVDGEVMTGPHGWAGEIGHFSVEPGGPQCRCGARGCLEQYAGKQALMVAAGLPVTASAADLLARADGPDGATARAALERAGWALGITLAGAVNLLDIDQILLGGELAPLAERLAPAVEAELRARVLAAPWATLSVRAAGHDPALAARGAALTALATVVEAPARWVPAALPA
ncbi:ROK family transcriptional regulator [Georgenia sp. M64]|uniref:ROK family transcriptional regulator n=1 Tax=Georgenia sp. M64 TaxID=3120520 RepID=UPI0030E30689